MDGIDNDQIYKDSKIIKVRRRINLSILIAYEYCYPIFLGG
jgi:hypothetical protein